MPLGASTARRDGRTRRPTLAAAGYALVALTLLSLILYGLSEKVLKSAFQRGRPLCQIEHSLVAAAIEGDLTPDQYASLSGHLFRCPVGTVLFAGDRTGDAQGLTYESALEEVVRSGWPREQAQRHLRTIRDRTGIGPYEVSPSENLRILRDASPWKDRGLAPFLLDFLGVDEDDCDELDSAPSGHVIRQAAVLALAIVFSLERYKMIPLFRGKPWLNWLLLGVNGLVFLWCVWSRVYGYKHNLSDVMISFVLSLVLLAVVAILALQRSVMETTFGRSITRRIAGSDLIQAAGVMVVYFDREDDLLVWNPACARVTGYGVDEIQTLDDYVDHLYPEADRDEMRVRLRQAVCEDRPDINVLTLITTARRRKQLVLWNATPIHSYGPGSEVIGKLSVGVPITWTDARLAELGFISVGVLHDIRRALVEAGDLLKDTIGPFCQGHEQVHSACQRVEAIVADLVSTARDYRSYAIGDVVSKGHVDLQEVVAEALDGVQRLGDRKGIKIRTRMTASDTIVVGHPQALLRLLINLLMNSFSAIEARCEGEAGQAKEVVVSLTNTAREDRRFVAVEVADTGGGLAPSIGQMIDSGLVYGSFEDPDVATGVGLATVHLIATDHGGQLYWRRRRHGAVVGVRIPLTAG